MARKHETTPVRNAIIVGDLHAGCQLGLCPPRGARLDNNGIYRPNKVQKALNQRWRMFWRDWAPEVCRGEPYCVVVNGDLIDGVHHGSTNQWTHNLTMQCNAAYEILAPIRDACQGRLYIMRGTPVHGGESGQQEEQLAGRLDAIPDEAGQHARNELWLWVGGALCHVLHHIGTTASSAHESSAVNSELTAEFVEAARWGQKPPDYVIRSHRHRCISVKLSTSRGYAVGVVAPGWQGKTPFAFKVAGARLAQPQWGGILIRQGDEEHYMREKVWTPDRPKAVRA